LRGNVGQLEELAPGVRPAQRWRDCALRACRIGKAVIAGIGIGLKDAGEAGEMPLRMLPAAIELCVNLGDGLSGQAAAFSRPASMPSVNLTPVISFGN
jgi:hypothetical protein